MKSKTRISCPYEDCIKTGLRAIPQKYKKYFCGSKNLTITSIDIDECFKKQCPRENRWDYGIKIEETQKIKFVEVHSANTSEVSTMKKKFQWLKCLLLKYPQCLKDYSLEYYWVPSTGVHIPQHTRQYKQLKRVKYKIIKKVDLSD